MLNNDPLEINPYLGDSNLRVPSGVIRCGDRVTKGGKDGIPQNRDYFVLKVEDLGSKRLIDTLVENYADPDGKVRRIPIWLDSDDLTRMVVPHSQIVWEQGKIVCQSVVADDGEIMCAQKGLELKPCRREPLLDGRGKIIEQACYYEVNNKCKFGFNFYFFTPGMDGLSPLCVKSHSWHSFKRIWSTLQNIKRLRHSVAFTLPDGRPFLAISKIEAMVPRFDGGTPKRTKQFLVDLRLAEGIEAADVLKPSAKAEQADQEFIELFGSKEELTVPQDVGDACADGSNEPATVPVQTAEEPAAAEESAPPADVSAPETPEPPATTGSEAGDNLGEQPGQCEITREAKDAGDETAPETPPQANPELLSNLKARIRQEIQNKGISGDQIKAWLDHVLQKSPDQMEADELQSLLGRLEAYGRDDDPDNTIYYEILLAHKLLAPYGGEISLADIMNWLASKGTGWGELCVSGNAPKSIEDWVGQMQQHPNKFKQDVLGSRPESAAA
jgi:hypothetical protein